MLTRRAARLRLPSFSHISVRTLHASRPSRATSSDEYEAYDPDAVERDADACDVLIVGAGPAGLSAAIRLKQLEQETGKEVRVVVLEKGAEVGSHILSGAVIEPRALDELLPDWRGMPDHPLTQPATSSRMRLLTRTHSFPMPHPPQMNNAGNYIVSLSRFTAWLGGVAEALGVEVYPGFAGAGLVRDEQGRVRGVRTHDAGIGRDGRPGERFEPGMVFRARTTLLAEGAHGSLTKSAARLFDLRKDSDPQTYGIGLKEVWRVDPAQYRPGEVVHTMGWPLDMRTYGGGWIYHMADGLVSLGLVVGLDYANPWLSPYRELQRMKHHPYFRTLLGGASERLGYGARVLNEGGLQSIPKLAFPGGALLGCAAGFVNVPKIKGTHNAMKSGMLAAEAAFAGLRADPQEDAEPGAAEPVDMQPYADALEKSWVYDELRAVRNMRSAFNTPLGVPGGVAYSGLDAFVLRGRVPWTFRNRTRASDAAHTRPAAECEKIEYPPFEAPLSTDLLTSVALTGTNHAEEQPAHLRVVGAPADPARTTGSGDGAETAATRAAHVERNVGTFAGLLGRACPAAVYEYVEDDGPAGREDAGGWNGHKLVINAQNCIHCKLCDVKVPTQDINWTTPEGGGGPKYTIT